MNLDFQSVIDKSKVSAQKKIETELNPTSSKARNLNLINLTSRGTKGHQLTTS